MNRICDNQVHSLFSMALQPCQFGGKIVADKAMCICEGGSIVADKAMSIREGGSIVADKAMSIREGGCEGG